MKRERVNKDRQYELQIATAEQRLAAAKDRAAYWEQRLKLLQAKQLRFRLKDKSPLGRLTRKNQKKHLMWNSVRQILTDTLRDGLSTAEIYQAMREEHPNLNIITFRAYLREFHHPMRLLERHHNLWCLSKMLTSAAASSK
jgi:hypothetical protein